MLKFESSHQKVNVAKEITLLFYVAHTQVWSNDTNANLEIEFSQHNFKDLEVWIQMSGCRQ